MPKPKNYKKYKDDPTNVVFISHFGLQSVRFMKLIAIITQIFSLMGEEELIMPYKSPLDKKVHRWVPDFFIKYKNSSVENHS